MENTRQQQIAADALVTAAILALGVVLAVAGRGLAGNIAPGASGDWLRIDTSALDGAQQLSVDVLLGLVASLVGLAVVAWWLLSAAIAMASALFAIAGAHRTANMTGAFAPAFMRRLALAMLGIGLASTPAAHAQGLPDPAWQPIATHSALSTGPAPAASVPGAATRGNATAPVPLPSVGPLTPSPAASLAPSSAAALAQAAAGASGDSRATPATPATPATSTVAPAPSAVQPSPTSVPQAAWVPSALPADPGPLVLQPKRGTSGPGAVEVRPGDTLWSIVARHLGPGASELQIAEAWPAWYRANAGLIGDNPNLIHPGVLLMPPG